MAKAENYLLTKSEYIHTSQISAPVTKYEKFDFWLWKESISLAYQHLLPAPWTNHTLLVIYRILCFLFLWSVSLYHLINN